MLRSEWGRFSAEYGFGDAWGGVGGSRGGWDAEGGGGGGGGMDGVSPEAARGLAEYEHRLQTTREANAAREALLRGDTERAAAILASNPEVGIETGGRVLTGQAAANYLTGQARQPPLPSSPSAAHEVEHLTGASQQSAQAATARATVPRLPDLSNRGVPPLTMPHGLPSGQIPLDVARTSSASPPPPPPPPSTARDAFATRGGIDRTAVQRQQLIEHLPLPPLPPGQAADPAHASQWGVRIIVDTRNIDPNSSNLGRQVSRQNLIQYGLTPEMAELFLQGNQEWTYRRNFGRGEQVNESELRAKVASGQIDSTMSPESVRVIETFRNRPVMRAATQTDAERLMGTTTDLIDGATGRLPSYLGDPINRFAVSGLRLTGEAAALGAGIQRTVNDVARAVLPDSVDRILSEQDERNRQTVAALRGADSEVTARDSMADRVAAQHGIRVPFISRLARDLPRAPETVLSAVWGTASDIAEGAIYGEFSDNHSVGAEVGRVASGFVPGLGQAGDARDITAAGIDVAQGEQGSWARLGISIAAIVPGLDFLKVGSRAGRRALAEVAEEGLTNVSRNGLQQLGTRLSREGAEVASRELIPLSVAREEMMARLEHLASDTMTSRSTREALQSARNSLEHSLTQDDLVGALRDRHGIPVIINGRTYDHLNEVNEALSSLRSARREVLRNLRQYQYGTPEYRRLSQEAEALQETLRRVEGYLGIN